MYGYRTTNTRDVTVSPTMQVQITLPSPYLLNVLGALLAILRFAVVGPGRQEGFLRVCV